MFGLLYGLWCHVTTKPEIKILLLGLENSGKTTFVDFLKKNVNTRDRIRGSSSFKKKHSDYEEFPSTNGIEPQEDGSEETVIIESNEFLDYMVTSTRENAKKYTPTVGLNLYKSRADKRHSILFWDLGGTKALRSIWEKYLMDAHALIFFIDAIDAERFVDVEQLMDYVIEKSAKSRSKSKVTAAKLPVLVLANKIDHEDFYVHKGKIKEMVENRFMDKWDSDWCMIRHISAVNGDGVLDALANFMNMVVNFYASYPTEEKEDVIEEG